MKLSVIVPVYNEKDTVDQILSAVEAVNLADLGVEKEIIVVDDCSTDGTDEVLAKWKDRSSVKMFRHQHNQGKGAAVRTALKESTGDIVIIQDADLEYDPNDYRRILVPILKGKADVVYGSRFVGSQPHRVPSLLHYFANKCITALCDLVIGLKLSDVETCYKAFRRQVLDSVELTERGFGFDVEITIKAARKRNIFYEVGISYYGRDYAQGKKIKWTDGVRALYLILKFGLTAW